MAESKSKAGEEAPQTKTIGMGIRLVPSATSDQPVVANYSAVTLAPGMGFIDFGFLEPGMLATLPRLAKEGGKLPESINGRLAVRVALSYETLANLHQQLSKALGSLQAAAKRGSPSQPAP
jgi:hypothetical protein